MMTLVTTVDEHKLMQVLESVCQLGCNKVTEVIWALDEGKVPEAAQSLNKAELTRLHKELIEIMSPLQHD